MKPICRTSWVIQR